MNKSQKQSGFVLITSLILLTVLSLLGIMALRGSIFEERVTANDRDIAYARENAELALRDAERDIQGIRFDGSYCAAVVCTNLRPTSSRPIDATESANFWRADNEVMSAEIVALENGGAGGGTTTQGVYTAQSSAQCGMPVWSGANWQDGVARTCTGTFSFSLPTVAYGTFTDAPFTNPSTLPPRYMMEMFMPSDLNISSTSSKLFFRITAVGFGRTLAPNGARTSVTLQSVYSPL